MYTPASFAIHDVGALHDFIDAHGFGIIVGAGCDGAAQISHLPFLLDRERCCLRPRFAVRRSRIWHAQTPNGRPSMASAR